MLMRNVPVAKKIVCFCSAEITNCSFKFYDISNSMIMEVLGACEVPVAWAVLLVRV